MDDRKYFDGEIEGAREFRSWQLNREFSADGTAVGRNCRVRSAFRISIRIERRVEIERQHIALASAVTTAALAQAADGRSHVPDMPPVPDMQMLRRARVPAVRDHHVDESRHAAARRDRRREGEDRCEEGDVASAEHRGRSGGENSQRSRIRQAAIGSDASFADRCERRDHDFGSDTVVRRHGVHRYGQSSLAFDEKCVFGPRFSIEEPHQSQFAIGSADDALCLTATAQSVGHDSNGAFWNHRVWRLITGGRRREVCKQRAAVAATDDAIDRGDARGGFDTPRLVAPIFDLRAHRARMLMKTWSDDVDRGLRRAVCNERITQRHQRACCGSKRRFDQEKRGSARPLRHHVDRCGQMTRIDVILDEQFVERGLAEDDIARLRKRGHALVAKIAGFDAHFHVDVRRFGCHAHGLFVCACCRSAEFKRMQLDTHPPILRRIRVEPRAHRGKPREKSATRRADAGAEIENAHALEARESREGGTSRGCLLKREDNFRRVAREEVAALRDEVIFVRLFAGERSSLACVEIRKSNDSARERGIVSGASGCLVGARMRCGAAVQLATVKLLDCEEHRARGRRKDLLRSVHAAVAAGHPTCRVRPVNARGGIRTPNRRFRRPMLYPIELRAQRRTA